jgi:protein-S-isoprenylcysteine O-methyltransferase Ste14
MTPTSQPSSHATSYVIKAFGFRAITLVILLVAAGRWDWFWAWLNVGIFAVFDTLSIVLVDPDLLVERTRRSADQKAWDKPLVGLAVGLLPLIGLVIAGLDERSGWSADISAIFQWIAALAIVIGYGITVWAMRVNAYFSAIVRIQTDRGHQVATGGPYRLVRHPGYVGAILFTLATPVMLDSWWALIPAVIACVVYVIRTRKEDDTLQAELPGYREFAQRTPFRLIPGVW